MMRKHPIDRWLSPYEPEVTRSKRVGGIQTNGDGAAAARAADNREDTGSKPVLRISHHIAPVHQGTRATNRHGAAASARGS